MLQMSYAVLSRLLFVFVLRGINKLSGESALSFCLISEKRAFFKRKEFAYIRQKEPIRVDPFSEGDKTILTESPP